MATIKDVAKYAGVSTATVSRVINHVPVSYTHLDTGSRDFFFMTIDSSSGYDRIRGYSHFLSEHGLNFQDFPRDAALPQIQDGYNSMKKIIQQGFHRGAVCCGCDLMAVSYTHLFKIAS